jgi:aspartyl-tRNA(Asn)/glutamyl-tRNA(Gln) amidotransferase subunit A
MNYKTIKAAQEAIQNGITSCAALVEYHLEAIQQYQDHNIFLEVFQADARSRATVVDEKIKRGNAGRLAGAIIGIKDNIVYKDHVSSAASKILEGFTSIYSATVVERLLAEDAIIIGRLNCDEFAMGSANENSAYGPVKNPLDATKVPGGSSGGSAAAVAANLCQVALGSDTGGSIRQPAAFCGVVGYKPTYGLVSRYGLIAYASSFDQIGPITKSVEDAALILEIIAGFDPHDATSSQKPVPAFAAMPAQSKPKKIGYITTCVENEGLDPEVRAHMQTEMERLRNLGHELVPIDFPYLDYLVPIYYLLTTAEASSNLARFDGIHFGYRSPNATDLESAYKKSRTEGFGTEVKRRIMLGTFVLSSGFYEAYYGKAQKARRLITNKTLEALEKVDFLLTPTSPHTAFPLGQDFQDPTVMYLEDLFTVQANITGIPAIALPTGQHSNGLPFGIQLMGRPFEDAELLAFSNEILNN